MHKSIITASLLCSLSSFTHAQDRFASLVEGAGESIVTSGGSYAAEVPTPPKYRAPSRRKNSSKRSTPHPCSSLSG